MAIIYDHDINKHTDWDGDESTFGKPVSGRAVQKFIKDTLNSKIGYIYEDIEEKKFYGFTDREDFNKWVTTGKDPLSSLIVQKWDSSRINPEEIKEYSKTKIGYVYEDHDRGRFIGFTSEEAYNQWVSEGESLDSRLIISQWNNSKEQGIPIYTRSYAESLVDADPDKYIVIPDESDITNSTVEGRTYDTSINGPLANILFSAIRQLQSEIAKIKNTFDYGLYSYTGANTAMSKVEHGYIEDIDEEPLWAVDEEDLSMVDEPILGELHSFFPSENVTVVEEDYLKFNDFGAKYNIEEKLNEITDPKIFVYLSTTGQNIQFNLQGEEASISLNLKDLSIPIVQAYDILFVLSKSVIDEGIKRGSDFIWITITNRNTDNVIAEGYYKNGILYPNIQQLSNKYTLKDILFKDLYLSKFKIYSKYTDFSREVIPSKPSEDNYKYKVAHITIRSVANYSILESIKDQLPENELIFVEKNNRLYIKNNYKLVLIGAGGGEDTPIDDSGMTREETLELLSSMGISADEQGNLALLSDIVFIHQDTGIKFKLNIDSEGNISTTELSGDSLSNRIKNAFGINATSVGDDNGIRGFVGRLGLATQHVEKAADEPSFSVNQDIKLYSDRIKIGSFYAPAKTNPTFGCSHCFIELENTSNKDFPLEGCYLHFARNNSNNVPVVSHLALKGVLPAGGTYLIRGAKKAEFDDPNTFIKVTTFDQEWFEDGKLIDFSHNGEVLSETINDKTSYFGNDPHGFALTFGDENLSESDQLWFSNSSANDSKALFLYKPTYIDSVYYNKTFSNGNQSYWTVINERMYCIQNGKFLDCIYKNTFELDPAKQAYQALNTYDSSRHRHQNVADYQYLELSKEFIEFPKTSEKCPVSRFTPKASFEHKNVCTDKTPLDIEKPNMVTCSFGKNPYTTRCFNWISGGLFDEYVFIKQGNNWIKFESYKEGDESKTQEEGALKRKEFNNVDIINCIYKRITGRFPAANTQYTSHKCIINITTQAVQSPTEYTYVVGRADKEGNPDLKHCSEEYTFTLYPTSYTPRIYQTTDQQGFHWVEYQSWGAAAEEINKQIINESSQENIIPVLVNTGDMTQSGARINEWLDYYNAGKSLFKHLEQQNVVGNNDLCGNDFNILGTGDDEGKANAYYFHVFYCYEVETEEGMIPIINNKYVPSLYRILFNDYLLIAVNSEITTVNCKGWYNALSGNDPINVYTGWTIPSEGTPQYTNTFTSIYTMIYNMTNSNKKLIAMCHEMPFTVITAENLYNNATIKGRWRSQSGAASLVGSHLNQLGVKDTIGTHWFSRLLEYRKCKLCIGGHKHTYAVTYPLMENYIYGNNSSKNNGPMNMESTLEHDDQVTWIVDGKNLSKYPLTTRTLPNPSDTTIWPSEHVDSFYPGNSGVIYFMCQATGFKLMSNKELPSPDQTFSQYIPKSNLKRNENNEVTKSSASPEQRYPMYAVIELGNTWKIKLIRLANIQSAPTTLFTQINHSKANVVKQYLYDNSAENVSWKYGGWSSEDRVLLEIN